jgi:hypothetical protein
MTQPAPAPPALDPVRWLNNQPYLLLTLTSLFWAGNIVLRAMSPVTYRPDVVLRPLDRHLSHPAAPSWPHQSRTAGAARVCR